MLCPDCGAQNRETVLFCQGCGSSLKAQVAELGQNNLSPTTLHLAKNPIDRNQTEALDALTGRIIDNRYRIETQIGVSETGAVYRATRLLIGDPVAIKILNPSPVANQSAGESFRRAAQAAARLKHPNAVMIYDFGISPDGLQYLVMELAKGESVRQLIARQGALAPYAVAQVTKQVCAALDEAHRQNLFQSNIKPDNIFIDWAADGLRVKVLGLGLDKLRDQSAGNRTKTVNLTTKPHYASPEQCLGEELDARSEVYSLGVVLYEMLCGIVPFDSTASTQVVLQHVNQPPPALRAVNASLSPAIEAVVMRALEKRREARQQSAGALAQALTNALNAVSVPQVAETMAGLPCQCPNCHEEVRPNWKFCSRCRTRLDTAVSPLPQTEQYLTEQRSSNPEPLSSTPPETVRAIVDEISAPPMMPEMFRASDYQMAVKEDRPQSSALSDAEESTMDVEDESTRPTFIDSPKHDDFHQKETSPPEATLPGATFSYNSAPVFEVASSTKESSEEIFFHDDDDGTKEAASADVREQLSPASEFSLGEDNSETPFLFTEPRRKSRRAFVVAGVALLLVAGFIVFIIVRNQLSRETAIPEPTPKPVPDVAPTGMVKIPGGKFVMGRDAKDGGDQYESPAHQVTVKPFYLDIYEVTCEQYQKFVDEMKYPAPASWPDGKFPKGSTRLPVTGVDWADAYAYAHWAGKRLPTEEEWEFAARGTDGRLYPWGNQWERGIANDVSSGSGKLVEVGTYKQDVSPFEVFDMVGNAWEWTASDLQAYPGGQLPKQLSGDNKVIRGGSWQENQKQATATYRGYLLARGAKDYTATGFRCAKDISTTPSP
jgi:formylglycine-generating enzyme required for sulfatase activity